MKTVVMSSIVQTSFDSNIPRTRMVESLDDEEIHSNQTLSNSKNTNSQNSRQIFVRSGSESKADSSFRHLWRETPEFLKIDQVLPGFVFWIRGTRNSQLKFYESF